VPHFSKVMKGQHSEFTAAGWLVKQNYLVYFKTQDNDPMDLVAIERDTGDVLKKRQKGLDLKKQPQLLLVKG